MGESGRWLGFLRADAQHHLQPRLDRGDRAGVGAALGGGEADGHRVYRDPAAVNFVVEVGAGGEAG